VTDAVKDMLLSKTTSSLKARVLKLSAEMDYPPDISQMKNSKADRENIVQIIIDSSDWDELKVELKHVMGMAGHTQLAQTDEEIANMAKEYSQRQQRLAEKKERAKQQQLEEQEKAENDACIAAEKDRAARLRQRRRMQRDRDMKREERKKKGEEWEVQNKVCEAKKHRQCQDQIARRKKEEEIARKAVADEKAEKEALRLEERERQRLKLHAAWRKEEQHISAVVQNQEQVRNLHRTKDMADNCLQQQQQAQTAKKVEDRAQEHSMQGMQLQAAELQNWNVDQHYKQDLFERREAEVHRKVLEDHRKQQADEAAAAARAKAAHQAKQQLKSERRAALHKQEQDRLDRMTQYTEVALQEASIRQNQTQKQQKDEADRWSEQVSTRHDNYVKKWRRLDKNQDAYHRRRADALQQIYLVDHPMFGRVDIRRARSAGQLGANLALAASFSPSTRLSPLKEAFPLHGKHTQYGRLSPNFDRQFMTQSAPSGMQRSPDMFPSDF